MFNGTQGFGADFQSENFAQSFTQERNALQVGQKTTTSAVVSVADVVSALCTGTCDITFLAMSLSL